MRTGSTVRMFFPSRALTRSHPICCCNATSRREGIDLADTFKGRTVLISGSGNVAQFAALKVIAGVWFTPFVYRRTRLTLGVPFPQVLELGGKVLSLSDSTGSMMCAEGFTAEDITKIADIKLQRLCLTAADLKYKYVEGSRPWTLVDKIDIALPCATQNEVSEEEAKYLLKAGCKYVAEGSNMVSSRIRGTRSTTNVGDDDRL